MVSSSMSDHYTPEKEMFGLQEEFLTAYGLLVMAKMENQDSLPSLEFAITEFSCDQRRAQYTKHTLSALVTYSCCII